MVIHNLHPISGSNYWPLHWLPNQEYTLLPYVLSYCSVVQCSVVHCRVGYIRYTQCSVHYIKSRIRPMVHARLNQCIEESFENTVQYSTQTTVVSHAPIRRGARAFGRGKKMLMGSKSIIMISCNPSVIAWSNFATTITRQRLRARGSACGCWGKVRNPSGRMLKFYVEKLECTICSF